MFKLAECLRYYVHDRLNSDPGWQDVKVSSSITNSKIAFHVVLVLFLLGKLPGSFGAFVEFCFQVVAASEDDVLRVLVEFPRAVRLDDAIDLALDATDNPDRGGGWPRGGLDGFPRASLFRTGFFFVFVFVCDVIPGRFASEVA